MPPSARANFAQGRVDDGEGPGWVIRARPGVTPTTASPITVTPLLGIESPHAEQQTGEHSGTNNGQEQDRQRFLDRRSSQQECDRAHKVESSAPAEHRGARQESSGRIKLESRMAPVQPDLTASAAGR